MLESTSQVDMDIIAALEHQFHALDVTNDGHLCPEDFPEGMGLKKTSTKFNGHTETITEVVKLDDARRNKQPAESVHVLTDRLKEQGAVLGAYARANPHHDDEKENEHSATSVGRSIKDEPHQPAEGTLVLEMVAVASQLRQTRVNSNMGISENSSVTRVPSPEQPDHRAAPARPAPVETAGFSVFNDSKRLCSVSARRHVGYLHAAKGFPPGTRMPDALALTVGQWGVHISCEESGLPFTTFAWEALLSLDSEVCLSGTFTDLVTLSAEVQPGPEVRVAAVEFEHCGEFLDECRRFRSQMESTGSNGRTTSPLYDCTIRQLNGRTISPLHGGGRTGSPGEDGRTTSPLHGGGRTGSPGDGRTTSPLLYDGKGSPRAVGPAAGPYSNPRPQPTRPAAVRAPSAVAANRRSLQTETPAYLLTDEAGLVPSSSRKLWVI
jgi:hypothetical protein